MTTIHNPTAQDPKTFTRPDGSTPEMTDEKLTEALRFEQAEELRVAGIDGHAESASPDALPPDDSDMLADGTMGTAHGTASGAGESVGGAAYVESASGGIAVTEVEGYDPRALEVGQEHAPGTDVAEVVFGADDRVRVFNTRAYPWRTICRLEITAANGQTFGCSGAMIGPRTVLTNGHCVYMHDKGGWVKQIRVIPGSNGADAPFGSAVSSQFISVDGWVNSASSNYDYAVIILPRSHKLGNTVGWMGLANLSFFSLMGLKVNNSGYPGDKDSGTQWWNANNVLAVTDRRVYYRLDTYGGQSGSPVWRFKDGKRHIVAVHNTGGTVFNGSVRLVKPVFDNLVNWKNLYT